MWQNDSDHKVTYEEGLWAIRVMAPESLSSTKLGKQSKVVHRATVAPNSPTSLGNAQLGPDIPSASKDWWNA